jgi:hypothetical protein
MSIGRFFHNIAHPFVVLFQKIVGSDAFKSFVSGAEDLLKSKLGVLAWDAVQAAAVLTTDGAGKRAFAFAQIVKEAEKLGLEYKDSIINLLIEVAVQKLKGNAGV